MSSGSSDKSASMQRLWLLGIVCFAVALLLVEGVIWIGAALRANEPIPVNRGRLPTTKDGRIEPNQLDAFITANMQRTGIPGVALAVVKRGEIAYTAGYGVVSTGEPVRSATPFPIASLSKSFTAAAVLRLVEAGRLSLADPLQRVLPDMAWIDARIARITIAQLLNQSSGLACDDTAVRDANAAPSLRDAVERLRFAALHDEPGATWRYCNANYHLLAAVVERLTGEDYVDHLSRSMLAPLGMSNSATLTQLRERSPSVPEGHVLVYGFAVPHRNPAELGLGASGIVSSADDLANWLSLQLEAPEHLTQKIGLSRTAIETMHRPSAPGGDATSNYGYGWRRGTINEQPYVFHSGRIVAYSAHQAIFPEAGYAYAIVWNGLHPLGAEQRSFINGLNALMLGEAPTLGQPIGRIVDSMLAAFTLLWLAIGIGGGLSAKQWVQREWPNQYTRAALSTVAYAAIALAIVSLPLWTPQIYAQDLWLPLLFDVWPAVALLLFATALSSLCIAGLRSLHVGRAIKWSHLVPNDTPSA